MFLEQGYNPLHHTYGILIFSLAPTNLNIYLDLTTLQTLALDYAIAIYPLLLVIIIYIVIELHARWYRVLIWLWRPFHRCCVRFMITRAMDIQSSIIKVFATFLLLS